MEHKNTWTDKEVEIHWDNVADIYVNENTKVERTHDQRFAEAIKYIDLNSNSNVLNVSSRDCGILDYINNIKENESIKVFNAEISQGLINVAHEIRPEAIQIKIETYSKLPFRDNTFNRIFSFETLEHVSDPIEFLKELYRVSIPKTRMVLSCPPLTSELSYKYYTKFFGGHGEGPHRFLCSKEVKIMLRKTGWKLLLHKGTLLIPIGPYFMQIIGEKIINKFQKTFISELGIRQFYVCEKYC